MTVTVNHAKTNAISDFTQAQLDEQIALGNFAPGTTLADIVLPSDWNDDHTLTGLGTMAEQNANTVAITGGSVNGTTIGATTASTGAFTSVTTPSVTATTTDLTLSAISTGAVKFNTLGGEQVRITDATTAGQFTLLSRGNALNEQQIVASGTANLGLYATGGGVINFWTATTGEKQLVVSRTASAVNHVQVTGAATGGQSSISAQGSDATTNIQLAAKGGGNVVFSTNGAGSAGQFLVSHTNSSVNYYTVTGAATGFAPRLFLQGTDTNISMAFQPQGTGAIDLAAGSRGVNISNGGTVTAITRTATGSGYATAPTVAISAPTTAGGVQATATCTVTAGAVNTTFTITNAGSGYIEQPTITFSGGGGSGAAAYATVGTTPIVKSLGSSLFLATPGGTGFAVVDNGQTSVNYWAARGAATNNAPALTMFSTTSVFANIDNSNANSIGFRTSGNVTQAVISHTASAVNHVQVTGGATGNGPTISAQGSDTNAFLAITSKGTSAIRLQTGGSTQVLINNTTSAINQLGLTGSTAGQACSIIAQGTDTNIDLALTPKGTGNVRFGTHTATADVAISGYIEIKDSGGTLRKLAVIT